MHFDALTLACMADELRSVILGGRVQQVLLPDENSVGMEVYAQRERQQLFLNTDPQTARVQLTSAKLRRGAGKDTPLLLLLRKYVRGAVLTDIVQPDPAERVLNLHFEHSEYGATRLVVEAMGRMSNLLLLASDNTILDCMHRVPKSSQTRRVLLPGQPYQLPPPVDKLPPIDDGRPDYYAQLGRIAQQDGPLWKALLAQIAGVSPSQARELAWRMTGDAAAPADAAETLGIAQALQQLWAPVSKGGWLPGNTFIDGEIVAYSPYPLHYRGEFAPCASMSLALEQYYSAQTNTGGFGEEAAQDEYAAARGQAAASIRQAQQRVERQLAALADDEPAPGEPELLRSKAEWLLALGYSVQPGQQILTVDVNGDGSEQLRIDLDSRYAPHDQAQRMFKRAAKLERAAQIIPKRRRKLQRSLAFLDQLNNDLSMAENRPEIEAVLEELRSGGFIRQRTKTKAKVTSSVPGVRSFNSPCGYEILAGRNARQNEKVTFDMSHPQDVWLHARGVPGSHVVIRTSGRPVDEDDVLYAAQIAAYYSGSRGERSAEVIVAERRHVHRAPGGHPGQVSVRNDRTLIVPAVLPAV